MRQNLSEIDWDSNYRDDPDEYAQRITNIIIESVSNTIPNKTITINPQDPAWTTLEIKQKIRQRKRFYQKAKRTNSPQHWLKFKKLRNEIISCIRNTKKGYFDRMILRLRSGNLRPKDWWKALKSFVTESSSKSIPPLVDPITDQFVVDKDRKANVFNSFFASQSTIDDSSHSLPSEYPKFEGLFLNNIHITYTDVLDVLRTFSIGKASQPDDIDNRIVVEAASQLVNPLCRLFNLCLDKRNLPSSWKRCHVCPILKKGDPCIPSNYRPVSLLNSMEKVFERIIFKYVYNHLHMHRFFTPSQSGLIPVDSTVYQLTFLYDKICRALDNSLETCAVFFDISKAFDKVLHRSLIFKLQSAGINGNLLQWFQDYLSDRYQKVIIPGGSSDLCALRAGVPQGSVLGPLLFLIYINDIVNDIESDINLFADNTSLIKIVENHIVTSEVLQSNIDKIQLWADKWLV